jgi:hypothetical protein
MTQTLAWPDDLPDFDDPGTTITRHSYGGRSALLVIITLIALGLLVTRLMIADRYNLYNHPPAPARLADTLPAELQARYLGTLVPDYESYQNQQRAAKEESRREAIDWSYRILDPHDGKKLEIFLIRFGSHPYAEQQGYTRAARQALARVQLLEDQAEELRRREEQKAAPWDMGVRPPESSD